MYPSAANPGYGVFVKNFEDSLVERGVVVDRVVIVGRSRSALVKLFKYLVFFLRVCFLYCFRRYDCVYVHYIAHSLIPLVPLVGLKRVALICNAHGEDLLPRSKVEKKIFRLVRGTISKSKLIVVPSEYFASIAKAEFPNNLIFVSPSGGVDLDIFRPHLNTKDLYAGLHVGFVSRVDAGKGWDILLHAIHEVRKLRPDIPIKVSIVGEGGQVPQLKNLIEDLQLGSIASYLGGLPQHELPKFYSSLDVFVFPTTRSAESLGLVGLEALACGVPAICSDIGGIRDYMEDGVNGFLFPSGDIEGLANKIINFFDLSGDEISGIKFAALNTAQRYGRARAASDLHSKLTEVLSS